MKSSGVKVEIITIGDEILIGQIVDTNSAWMAVELNLVGFEVLQITSIRDHAIHITQSLDAALTRADVVLLTGGIGPTNDDITKQTLAKYFDSELVFDDSVLRNLERLFANRPGAVINALTHTQAMVPEKCTVIQNQVGTAPITWFEVAGKVVVSMPGVPFEMKHVMSGEVIPRLKKYFTSPSILHRTVLVYGYGESALAMKIASWENSLPESLSLAYLPVYGVVKLRLSGVSASSDELARTMDESVRSLTDLLGDAIVSFEDVPVEVLIGNQLKVKGLTVATAESCTGGYIAHLFTSQPGSSAYFMGSVVAYSNEVKTSVLGVDKEVIQTYGAVSQSVVEQMASGVLLILGADVAIATSGIAGPEGGTAEKPVGTVWIAVASKEKVVSREFRFGTLREQNIHRAAQAAMLMVREII